MTRTLMIGIVLVALGVAVGSQAMADDRIFEHKRTVAPIGRPAGVNCADNLSPGDYERQVPGWSNRDYILHIPTTYDCKVPTPVIIALHGGGSRKEDMRALTCPDTDLDNPACLDRLADREGFIVVYPDGTQNLLWRTFNATNWANGAAGWSSTTTYACVSGYACENNVDDISYFEALLDTLDSVVYVDRDRVFATGISNGASMAHRLACQLSDRIAAIAPVAGGNQFSFFQPCRPERAVPVIEFHGTADPAWGYGTETLDYDLNGQGKAISVPRTVAGWVERDACAAAPIVEVVPDRDTTDSSTVTRIHYEGCKDGAEVTLYRINGGGHMWPDGLQWDQIVGGDYGPTNRDLNGNEVIWEFFKAHPMRDDSTPAGPR